MAEIPPDSSNTNHKKFDPYAELARVAKAKAEYKERLKQPKPQYKHHSIEFYRAISRSADNFDEQLEQAYALTKKAKEAVFEWLKGIDKGGSSVECSGQRRDSETVARFVVTVDLPLLTDDKRDVLVELKKCIEELLPGFKQKNGKARS